MAGGHLNIALDHIERRVDPVHRSVLGRRPERQAQPQALNRMGAGSAGAPPPKRTTVASCGYPPLL